MKRKSGWIDEYQAKQESTRSARIQLSCRGIHEEFVQISIQKKREIKQYLGKEIGDMEGKDQDIVYESKNIK